MTLTAFLNVFATLALFYGCFMRGLVLYGKTQNRIEGISWLVAGLCAMSTILSWLSAHTTPPVEAGDIALKLILGLILSWKTVRLRKRKGLSWSYHATEPLRK